MRNAKRADVLLDEARVARERNRPEVAAWLTERAADHLMPSRTKRVVPGRPT